MSNDERGPTHSCLSVATCQFAVSGDITANAGWIREQMRNAKAGGATVAHFSECALSGYAGSDYENIGELDWLLLEEETRSLMSLARELSLWVILGSTHRLSDGHKPLNCLYVIDSDGRIADRYDKRFLTYGDLRHYSPGNHFCVVRINGIKCGLLICYDMGFPEAQGQYYKRGVDLIFHSFHNARKPEMLKRTKYAPVLGQAAAVIHHVYYSLSNTSAEFSWPSHFIEPIGRVVGQLPKETNTIMVNRIEVESLTEDPSREHRIAAIDGKLNTGTIVADPRMDDRYSL